MRYTSTPRSGQPASKIIPFPDFDRRAAAAVAQLYLGDTDIGDTRWYGPHADGLRRLVQAVRDYQERRGR